MRLARMKHLPALCLLTSSLCHEGHGTSSPSNWEQIHQVINLYPLAVDFNQTHELFPKIFAQDAFANYTSDNGDRSNLQGLQEIIDTFAPDGAKFGSQHLFGSITISVNDDGTKANATSYALNTAFGRGTHAGKQIQFYGVYRDTFELIRGVGWRIKTRFYNPQGPAYGDMSVLAG